MIGAAPLIGRQETGVLPAGVEDARHTFARPCRVEDAAVRRQEDIEKGQAAGLDEEAQRGEP